MNLRCCLTGMLISKNSTLFSESPIKINELSLYLSFILLIYQAIESDNIVPFFQGIRNNKTGQISNFAKKFNIACIAECVHSESVQQIINELEIEFSQGYLFSKPQELKQLSLTITR